MSLYRGLVILIALCAFGAIQASIVKNNEYHRYKHGIYPGKFNSSGSWNATRPGNYSGPIYSRPVPNHRYPISNSSHVGNSSSYYPGYRPLPARFNNTGNFSSSFPQRRRPIPGVYRKRLVSSPQERGFFNRKPSYGYNNSPVYQPAYGYQPAYQPAYGYQPAYQPAYGYQPAYQPGYRPAVNSTWQRPGYRPANNGSVYYG